MRTPPGPYIALLGVEGGGHVWSGSGTKLLRAQAKPISVSDTMAFVWVASRDMRIISGRSFNISIILYLVFKLPAFQDCWICSIWPSCDVARKPSGCTARTKRTPFRKYFLASVGLDTL